MIYLKCYVFIMSLLRPYRHRYNVSPGQQTSVPYEQEGRGKAYYALCPYLFKWFYSNGCIGLDVLWGSPQVCSIEH